MLFLFEVSDKFFFAHVCVGDGALKALVFRFVGVWRAVSRYLLVVQNRLFCSQYFDYRPFESSLRLFKSPKSFGSRGIYFECMNSEHARKYFNI